MPANGAQPVLIGQLKQFRWKFARNTASYFRFGKRSEADAVLLRGSWKRRSNRLGSTLNMLDPDELLQVYSESGNEIALQAAKQRIDLVLILRVDWR